MIAYAGLRLNFYWPNPQTRKYRYQLIADGGASLDSLDEESLRRIFEVHYSGGGLDAIGSGSGKFGGYIEIPPGIAAEVLEAFLNGVANHIGRR